MNRKQDKPYTQNRKQYDGSWKEQYDHSPICNLQQSASESFPKKTDAKQKAVFKPLHISLFKQYKLGPIQREKHCNDYNAAYINGNRPPSGKSGSP